MKWHDGPWLIDPATKQASALFTAAIVSLLVTVVLVACKRADVAMVAALLGPTWVAYATRSLGAQTNQGSAPSVEPPPSVPPPTAQSPQ